MQHLSLPELRAQRCVPGEAAVPDRSAAACQKLLLGGGCYENPSRMGNGPALTLFVSFMSNSQVKVFQDRWNSSVVCCVTEHMVVLVELRLDKLFKLIESNR